MSARCNGIRTRRIVATETHCMRPAWQRPGQSSMEETSSRAQRSTLRQVPKMNSLVVQKQVADSFVIRHARKPRTMSNSIAQTPRPPYYAVIFTSLRTEGDRGYEQMAQRMVELASQQPGFLGVESARSPDGLGITVSYWGSEEAIAAWKAHTQHKLAQETGQRTWYSDYQLRVGKVERAYGKRPT
jgi:heme-degrading monooxygenase HmoA